MFGMAVAPRPAAGGSRRKEMAIEITGIASIVRDVPRKGTLYELPCHSQDKLGQSERFRECSRKYVVSTVN